MSFIIHRPGPRVMEDIIPFIHSIIKNLCGIDSEQILNQANHSEQY